MKRSLPPILAFLAFAAARLSAAGGGDPFSVQKLSPTRWRIEVAAGYLQSETVRAESSFTRFSLAGFDPCFRLGYPVVPFKKWNFALPPGASLRFKILRQDERTMRTPWAPLSLPPLSDSSRRFGAARMREIPRGAEGEHVRLSPRTRSGNLEIQSVEFLPLIATPGSDAMRYAASVSIEVEMAGAAGAFAAASHALPRGTPPLVNPEHAVQRTAPAAPSVSSWYNAASPYVKFIVNRKGIYRVTRGDLNGLPVNWTGVDPKSIRILNRGVELPVYVAGEDDHSFDPGDYIDFTGDMNHGERGEWFDLWSDDNVYWMTWGGAEGKRCAAESIAPAGEPVMASRWKKLHLEEDHDYHLADNDDDGDISDYIAGETWIWKYLLKKDTLAIPFTLHDADPASPQGLINLRVKGSSRDSSRVQVLLNGTLVGQFTILSVELRTQPIAFPQSLLRDGPNTITVINAVIVDCPPTDPTCTIERFYVDWAEVNYRALFAADSDAAAISDTVGSARFRAQVANWSTRAVAGYNTTDGTRLTGFAFTGSGPAQTLDAAFNAGKEYLLSAETALLHPAAIRIDTSSTWASPANGADEIIVTHPAFRAQAERLAQYRRQKDGFRVAVVDVNDIYDEFNDGIKHPVAIRRFLKQAYDAWTPPQPRFVLFMGDASWDPKFLKANSVKQDFVPSWGNPAADDWYVAFDSDDDIAPKISNGRIPCETPQAADDVIDKIVAYESAPAAPWQKKVLMVNGGKVQWERDEFRSYSEEIIRTSLDPWCMGVERIYRTTDGIISYAELDTIVNRVNAGTLWFNFVGHGGPGIIDVGVDRPDIFRTQNNYPFFVTMSCNTAHFTEPAETGLNEEFIMAKNNGSICSFGTSGRGVMQADAILSDSMFAALTQDTVRTYGEISTWGKLGLIAQTSVQNQITRNLAQQYIILGDPATHIPLPRGPELAVYAADMSLQPEVLTDNIAGEVRATIRNRGTCLADSVTVEFLHTAGGREVERRRWKVPAFPVQMDVSVPFDVHGLTGTNRFQITLDPDMRVAEGDRTDNSAFIERNVAPEGVRPIWPLDAALIPSNGADTVRVSFVVSNPSLLPVDARGELLVPHELNYQIARDENFSSVTADAAVPLGKTFTGFSRLFTAAEGEISWWRAQIRNAGGAREWSEPRSFTLTKGSGEGWSQNSAAQFAKDAFTGADIFGAGVVRNSVTRIPIQVISGGSRNVELGNFANIKLNGVETAPGRRGFNVAVVNRRNGALVDTALFDTYWSSNYADDMADYLGTYDSSKLVILAVMDDANGFPPVLPGGTNITPRLKSRLAEFGARLIDSIKYRGSYALMGVRGLPALAREGVDSLAIVVLKDTITVRTVSGLVETPAIGPVTSLLRAERKDSVPANTSIAYALAGAGAADTVLARWSGIPDPVDVSGVPLPGSRLVRLSARLNDTSGVSSPSLDGWKLQFTSRFPELGINCQSVFAAKDSVPEGEPLALTVRVVNGGRAPAAQVPVRVRLSDAGSGGKWEQTMILAQVPDGGFAEASFAVPTAGLAGEHTYEAGVDPDGLFTEYSRGNNFFSKSFSVARDTKRPELEVLFDGAEIADNDYVSPAPEIAIHLRDDSPLAVTDTASIQMFLDGSRIFLVNNPQVNYEFPPAGKEKVRLIYHPALGNGVHSLAVNGKDASGNFADSLAYQVRFYVSDAGRVDQIYAYPNPASGATAFTFRCIGTAPPEKGSIRIYTVAGRLIREILIPASALRVGFNSVPWDCRDQDGDRLGNGLYFYKLILQRQGIEESYIDKLAVIR